MAHTVLQEGIQERIVGEIMDVPIPQVMEKTIEVVKAIPPKRLQQRTANADKPGVRVQVFKGERAVTKDDDLQGQFHLNEIPSAPCGAPQIEAIFDIDALVPQMAEQLLEVPKIIPKTESCSGL